MKENKAYKIDYLIVLLFILISANPFISRNKNIFIFILLIFLVFRPKFQASNFYNLSLKTFSIILFIFAYEMLHAFLFNNLNMLNSLRIVVFMYVGYLIVKILKFKLLTLYVSCIYFLSLFSLIMYPLMYTSWGVDLKDIADQIFVLPESLSNEYYYATTFIVYTFDNNFFEGLGSIYRNAGFAWEAGAFANYINLALLFNLFFIKKNSILNIKNIVFAGAIVTTFSTTGHIVMFLIITAYLFNVKLFAKINYLYLIIFLFFSIYIYQSANFLRDKINTQFMEAGTTQNRFGSALLDIKDVMRRPLFGWSRDTEVLFGKNNVLEAHRPNGITNLLRSYGFVYFFVYFILLYFSFKKMGKVSVMKKPGLFAIFFIGVLLVCAFSQLIFDNLMFRSMVFWGDNLLAGNIIMNYQNIRSHLNQV